MNSNETARVLRNYIDSQLKAPKPKAPNNGKIIEILLKCLEENTDFFCIKETDELIFFDEETKKYSNEGIQKVRGYCESVLRKAEAVPNTRTNLINEVEQHIRRNSYVSLEDFDDELLTLIPFQNGVYDLETNELLEYSSEYRFLNTLAVAFKPEAKCPKISRFLEEICTNSDGIVDSKMKRSLIQLIAYTLWRGYPIQKIVFLIGIGANGKGVFCSVLQALLGTKNVSSTSLIKLCHDRFSAADLEGMSANISNELTVAEVKNFDTVKSLVSGTDCFRVERKCKQAYTARPNFAKLISASNKPPKSSDASDGFYRRLILIFFQRQFLGANARIGLERELTTQEELSGVLNLALGELRLWIDENGNFKPDASFCCDMPVDEIRELYERASDTVAAFEYDCLDFTNNLDDELSKDELYAAYRAYCLAKKMPPMGDTAFKQDFTNRNSGKLHQTQKRKGDSRERVYVGLRLLEHMEQAKSESITTYDISNSYTRGNKEIPVPCVPNDEKQTILPNLSDKQPVPSVPIKILSKVPAFVGADGIKYGSFEPGQEIELPSSEADFLIKNSLGITLTAATRPPANQAGEGEQSSSLPSFSKGETP